jgi:hypothetical protein
LRMLKLRASSFIADLSVFGTGKIAAIVLLPAPRRQPSRIDGSAPLHAAHVHNDPGDAVDASRVQLGALLGPVVIDAAGEFHDAVMYLHTDRSGGDVLVSTELSENLLLNLRVIFHRSGL